MAVSKTRSVVLVATPSAPLLPALLLALYHAPEALEITLLTRKTALGITLPDARHHHEHEDAHSCDTPSQAPGTRIKHVEMAFDDDDDDNNSELTSLLEGKDTVICCLAGSDVSHLSARAVEAAQRAGVGHFLPSEYGLDTGNARIRELLPPYRTRFEMQRRLRASGMRWTAIYSGLVLGEAMQENGALDIDVLWGSVAVFPHEKGLRIALSDHGDVARAVVEVVLSENEERKSEVYIAGFMKTLEEVVAVVEMEMGRTQDRYDASLEDARKEAKERMKMGYFDGGVALMARVTTWDETVAAWRPWTDASLVRRNSESAWEQEVRSITKGLREGQIKVDQCGC